MSGNNVQCVTTVTTVPCRDNQTEINEWRSNQSAALHLIGLTASNVASDWLMGSVSEVVISQQSGDTLHHLHHTLHTCHSTHTNIEENGSASVV